MASATRCISTCPVWFGMCLRPPTEVVWVIRSVSEGIYTWYFNERIAMRSAKTFVHSFAYWFVWTNWTIVFKECHVSHIMKAHSFNSSVVTQTLNYMRTHTHKLSVNIYPTTAKRQLHGSLTQHAWWTAGYSRLFVFTYLSMIKPFSLHSYSHHSLILAL